MECDICINERRVRECGLCQFDPFAGFGKLGIDAAGNHITQSERDAGTPDGADDESSGRDGTAKGEQSDALGADDEQHPSLGRRDSS